MDNYHAPSRRTAAIIGASGYSGAELLRILLRHPGVTVGRLYASTSAGKRVADVYPAFRGRTEATYETYSAESAAGHDVVFIALPSGEAMRLVPGLLERGTRVIDLGGDFRLQDPALYQQYYEREHLATSVLPTAVYGFPEWHADRIRTATLLSNPGCYPTGAILPLAPLLKEGLIEPDRIVISSLSGVSGAGRASSVEMSFAEVNESVRAYKVGVHQHIPEIQSALSDLSGRAVTVTFVPHLIPIARGIYTSMYAVPTRPLTDEDIKGAYATAYSSAPFVRVLGQAVPEIKSVTGTNCIDIGWRRYPENGHLIVLSTIDNLVKGAAGQAVQSMNLMFGLRETEALW
ncbi:MAG: N-acetyl-gamma-glutamyl-phosphate reductase [Bacteroidetes bacterium]|jgi:N-acetyl-gamma-glutamyl-phosphate reductase|nr:N-acetyl-gamma-glutamyl-phosphate reductase [Bacteroidota bacterium]